MTAQEIIITAADEVLVDVPNGIEAVPATTRTYFVSVE